MTGYTVIVEYAKPKDFGPRGFRFQVYIESDDGSWSTTGTIVLTWQGHSGYEVSTFYVEDVMSPELFKGVAERFSDWNDFLPIIKEIEAEATKLQLKG